MGRRDDDGIEEILLGLGVLVAGGYEIYKAIKNANNPKQNKPPQIKQQRRIVKPSDYEDLLNLGVLCLPEGIWDRSHVWISEEVYSCSYKK